MWKTLRRRILPNPFDRLLLRLRRKGAKTFLLGWNRGMGDVPLGIYPLVQKIRAAIPDAEITFLIRKDLSFAFSLLPDISFVVDPDLYRGVAYEIKNSSAIDSTKYDVVIDWPDPTYWCRSMLGNYSPKLHWKKNWDALADKFAFDPKKNYVGLQPNTVTGHGSWRNWGQEKFNELIYRLEKEEKKTVLLFGSVQEKQSMQGGVDLRGKTNLPELFSLIKRHCRELILPDSGILSILYYLDLRVSWHVVSLWAKPLQGVLKLNVSSPNPLFSHHPIVGGYKELQSISVQDVLDQCKKRQYAGF